jgi:NRPS condensation-like uncharacterized protein
MKSAGRGPRGRAAVVLDRAGPLPCSLLDEIFIDGDDSNEPYTIELELRFSARLDDQRLRSALAQAMLGEPRARARLLTVARGAGRYQWDPAPHDRALDPLVVVRDSGPSLDRQREALLSEVLPHDRWPPFRVLLAHGPRQDVLTFSASHAVTDGVGLLSFVRAVAGHYGRNSLRQPSGQRSRSPRTSRSTAPASSDGAWGTSPAGSWLSSWIDPPARVAERDGEDQPGYRVRHRALSTVPRPPRPGSVNDLLLAALMLALDRWNREAGAAGDRLTVMVPIDLRAVDEEPGLRNASLPALVSTTAAERAHPERLLDTIVRQTSLIKAEPARATSLEMYRLADLVPSALRRLLPLPAMFHLMAGDRLVPTAVLSNLGSVEDVRFGDATARDLRFSPPARSPLGIAVGAVSCGGRLRFSFRTQKRRMGGPALEEFASLYVETLVGLSDILEGDAGQRL